MRELKVFKCGTCGRIYEDIEKCAECEKKHQKMVKYAHGPGYRGRYPDFIQATFEDGTNRIYIYSNWQECSIKEEIKSMKEQGKIEHSSLKE